MTPLPNPGDQPGLSPEQSQNVLNMAAAINRALSLPPQTQLPKSELVFTPADVFEMAIAGSQLAFWLISDDRLRCAVCGHETELADMSVATPHDPLCKVARWWKAVDALKVHLAVQPKAEPSLKSRCRLCGCTYAIHSAAGDNCPTPEGYHPNDKFQEEL